MRQRVASCCRVAPPNRLGLARWSCAAWLAASLSLHGAPAWAQAPRDTPAARYAIDTAPRTIQACDPIAALADRGADALRAADILGQDLSIDLRNDGHPQKVFRLDDEGSAHQPYLSNAAHQSIDEPSREDCLDIARWAWEITVLRIGTRIWEVKWDAGSLDSTAALTAATDGSAFCRYHSTSLPPDFRMLPGGKPSQADIYRALLHGEGLAPPSAGLDAQALGAASGLKHPGTSLFAKPVSWRVDLLDNGPPLTMTGISLASGAGRGCGRDFLAFVQDGRIAKFDFLPLQEVDQERGAGMAPLSESLRQLVQPLSCVDLTELPVLDRTGRAYVLLDNSKIAPLGTGLVRVLVGAEAGTMQPLARLAWRGRNEVPPPPKP